MGGGAPDMGGMGGY